MPPATLLVRPPSHDDTALDWLPFFAQFATGEAVIAQNGFLDVRNSDVTLLIQKGPVAFYMNIILC